MDKPTNLGPPRSTPFPPDNNQSSGSPSPASNPHRKRKVLFISLLLLLLGGGVIASQVFDIQILKFFAADKDVVCQPRPACLDDKIPCDIKEPAGGWCLLSAVAKPTPFCEPRPACLDTIPPSCDLPEPADGWCKPTLTCQPRPACLDNKPPYTCDIAEPANGWCPTPTKPAPSGCYYQVIQCVTVPCDPILICPSTRPTLTCQPRPACLDNPPPYQCDPPEPGGGWCKPTPTPTKTCIPRPPCLDANPRCYIPEPQDGWCPTPTKPAPSGCYYQVIQCITTPCDPILVCPSVRPTTACQPRPACLDNPPPYQCDPPEPGGGWCPTPTPTRTCLPRPACLDEPRPCRIFEPEGGWCPTPPPPVSLLGLSKDVRNITQNSSEADVVTANPGDTVEFVIRIGVSSRDTSGATLHITDTMVAGLNYITGSTTVNNTVFADGIVSSGVVLKNISTNTTVRFRARVDSAASFPVGTTTLSDVATARLFPRNQVPSKVAADTAFVNVTIAPGGGGGGGGGSTKVLDIHKFGRNITRGDAGENLSVTARPNDTIEFIIRVRAVAGAPINNVIVIDELPVGINYITNSTSVNGTFISSNSIVTSSGLNVGTVNTQDTVIKLFGKVGASHTVPLGTSVAINTTRTYAENASLIIAQLPVTIVNSVIAGASQVPTGASRNLLIALAISALTTVMYMLYTRTSVFNRKEIQSLVKKSKDTPINLKDR